MRPNIPQLTSLRFFAASLVVIFHYPGKLELFPLGMTNFGYEAVSFFFILSGFILTYVHGTATGLNVSTRSFLISRVSRIAPAYYGALALALPFFFLSIHFNLLSSLFVVSMTQAWIPRFALFWNDPAWSLSNEIFFYICYPAIFKMANRLHCALFFALAVCLVIFTELWRGLYFVNEDWHNFRAYFPLLNLPQFMVGVALGNLYICGLLQPRKWMLIIGAAAVCVTLGLKPQFPFLSNTIFLCFSFSLTIYGACIPIPGLGCKTLFILGEASYGIYILHAPIWLWWNHLTNVVLRLTIWPVLNFGIFTLVVVATSVTTLFYFEKPARKKIQHWLLRRFPHRADQQCTS